MSIYSFFLFSQNFKQRQYYEDFLYLVCITAEQI